MNQTFVDFVNKFVFLYIDNILIAPSSFFTEHFKYLSIVFQRTKEASLKIKLGKCRLITMTYRFWVTI